MGARLCNVSCISFKLPRDTIVAVAIVAPAVASLSEDHDETADAMQMESRALPSLLNAPRARGSPQSGFGTEVNLSP